METMDNRMALFANTTNNTNHALVNNNDNYRKQGKPNGQM